MVRVALWVVLVVMMVSLIVQSSAVALETASQTPKIDRHHGLPGTGSGLPGARPQLEATATANDGSEDDHPVVESFDQVADTTFPPVMTTSTRSEEDFLNDAVRETRAVEEDAGLLENEARREIYDEVTRSPGISMSEVADRTEVPLSTVRYHTWVLSTEDALDEAKIRGKRRLFPAMMDRERKELNAALEDEATARMLDAIHSDGPGSVTELAERLDRSASTVSYHLQRLQDAGLVERQRDDGATVTQLDPFVRAELSGAIEADGGLASDVGGASADE